MSRIPASVVKAVYERANEECECCGQSLWSQWVALHHRKAKKHGGPNTVENLMLVIDSHHNLHQDSIHQNPERSLLYGHIISQVVDNDLIGEVLVHRRERVR